MWYKRSFTGFHKVTYRGSKKCSYRGAENLSRGSARKKIHPAPFRHMFYVYIIKLKRDKGLYFGSTNDLRRRLVEHTKSKGDLDLIYY
ncbi:MAG: hypothetical protein COT91_04875 [Candidatus Doudnabacteria bacterium CG10_big_fil_rev_8_21_14_0_10_41_10]|uniref:GIY-YIG domain-containing protein n=1 Tax=Candidatus Doudnabacteria bacterium CG10_big_fil_rev_8_21_14_0_10_41_10 TaxID=1974551 RepID=A0A2H0VCA5_9BACT|nr:MAG: hypothetical protein COT91_04875 [Candidatus Doudnabacteria bacterium CG10_big_fil_rev_8_21_14_0_10_41_10]